MAQAQAVTDRDLLSVKAEPKAIKEAHRKAGENAITANIEIGRAISQWRHENGDKDPKTGKFKAATLESLNKLNGMAVSTIGDLDRVYEASELCPTIKCCSTWRAAVALSRVILMDKSITITVTYK